MHTDKDLLAHHEHKPSEHSATKEDLMARIESGARSRYGSALKPRFCNVSFGDVGLKDRHERLNPEEKRRRPD
jgi:hypothetical protein